MARTALFPAPIKGLLQAGPVVGAPMDAADVLENFICTARGARLRGGTVKYATTDDPVIQLMTYRSGSDEKLFAATGTDVYDITAPADPDVAPTADISGLTSGDWAWLQFANSGGQYLYMANGADAPRHYNGTVWATPAITGITPATLNFVWAHKKRLWFCEENTLSAWYLAVNAIAGAATEFPLEGVFRLGGALLFGGTWSQDSGDGRDDMIIFVTTEGEIAVYSGTDPATDFSLVGVYRIGRPLHKNAWTRAGGDTMIVTDDGIVSVAQAANADRAALQSSAITAPIEDLWQEVIARRQVTNSFPPVIWPTRTMYVIGVTPLGSTPRALICNTRTGAWSSVTGWDIQCSVIFDDQLYFGTASGEVFAADQGGTDNGIAYRGVWVPKFQEFGAGEDKFASHCRGVWKTDADVAVRLGCFQNYTLGNYDVPTPITSLANNKWGGGGVWGTGLKWGASSITYGQSNWQAVSGQGYSLAPVMVVSSDRPAMIEFEALAMHLRFDVGSKI